jgi:urea transport system permease protein
MTSFLPKREVLFITIAAVIGLVVLPCLNAFTPPESPIHVSNFAITVYGKYLCSAVLALGVNLLWGYTGLLRPGQRRGIARG